MALNHRPPTTPWHTHLATLGFTPTRRGGSYRLNGILFSADGAWSSLEVSHPAPVADPLREDLGKPGLWKSVQAAGGRRLRRVFDLPPAMWADAVDDPDLPEPAVPGPGCLAWALATADGTLAGAWQPPTREAVEAWIPPGGLTVRSGAVVRQGELIHRPGQLALRVPVLPRVPEDLAPARRSWLRELLLDGQTRWRMVRLGLAEVGGTATALAEVDLSGCPHSLLEALFCAGLVALRWAVEWLAQAADFLADVAAPCQALEVCPVRV